MPTPIRKVKKLPTIRERRHVKTKKTPRNREKTTAVRSIQDGFTDAMRADSRNKINKFRTAARQREVIEDYHDRQKLKNTMQEKADDEGDWEFDDRGVEIGLAMGRKYKHKTRRKRSRHKRSGHKRSGHKRSGYKHKSRRLGHKHSRRKSRKGNRGWGGH